MTRDEFLHELRIADDVGDDEPLTSYAQRLADHDADRRVLIKEQRQVIDEQVDENRGLRRDVPLMQEANAEQRAEIERLKAEIAYRDSRIEALRGFLAEKITECTTLQAQLATAKRESFNVKRFESGPCYLCGYNGANYYQPDTHACAKLYHQQKEQL